MHPVMSESMARRTLETLLDPSTVVDAARIADVRTAVAKCQDASLDTPPGSDRERYILERCAAAIARYRLY